MNRNPYFDYIDERLHILARRIETRGKLNYLDIHLHSENGTTTFLVEDL